MRTKMIWILCIGLTGRMLGQGDAVDPTPTPAPPAYDVRISFYTWPVRGVMHGGMKIPSLPKVVMRTGEGVVALPLQRNAQTEAFRYVGRTPPVLATPTSVTEDSEGNPQYEFTKVAELDPPRDVDQVVVILFPEERTANGQWRYIMVPASNVLVPDGRLRVINTTDKGLVLEINENLNIITPGKSLTLDPMGADRSSRRTRYRLRLHGKDDLDRARLLHTSVYRSSRERGNLIIAYEENGRVRTLKLENHEPPPPTPTPVPAE